MRGPSVVAILGGGLLVLVAQLAVWLTPVQSLLIDGQEDRPYLNSSNSPEEKDVARIQPAEKSPTPAPKMEVEVQAPAKPEPIAPDNKPRALEEPAQGVVSAVIGPPNSKTQAPELRGPALSVGTTDIAANAKQETAPVLDHNAAPDVRREGLASTEKNPVPKELFIQEAVQNSLSQPVLREGAHEEDLKALETFYARHTGPARWVTSAGLTPKAQALVTKIAHADDWGLDASDYPVPPPDFQASIAEDQAAVEVAIDLALLKYARAARGGRTDPKTVSKLFAHATPEQDPHGVLTGVYAAAAPDDYLKGLHPKHEQFHRLREALVEASTKDGAKAEDIKRLLVNMERWRWMPADLGGSHVRLNIPAFAIDVVKDGKVVQSQKAVVGSPKTPTPILSAELESILFNPHRVVPTSVIRKTVLPALKKEQNWFGGGKGSALKNFGLYALRQGKPIDPSKVDWETANLANYKFVKVPNAKDKKSGAQFLFPNAHDIDIRSVTVPSQVNEPVRAFGPSSPRIETPGKLAGVLLSEDKGWPAAKTNALMADATNKSVQLDEPIPVHISYFTVVVDDAGDINTLPDIYGLDKALKAAIASSEDTTTPAMLSPVPIPPRKPERYGSL